MVNWGDAPIPAVKTKNKDYYELWIMQRHYSGAHEEKHEV